MSEKKRDTNSAEEKSIVRELLGWVIYLVLIVGISFLIITFIGQRTRVVGHSMNDTLQNGDNLIVDKISYRFNDPQRFDIIVFPFQYEDHTYFIKRIIGLPGEKVQVKDGCAYINGEKLTSDVYGKEAMEDSGIADEEITLGENEYFVLGDNRNHSCDSRDPSVGVLTKDMLIGRAWVRIWPLNKLGVIKHGK